MMAGQGVSRHAINLGADTEPVQRSIEIISWMVAGQSVRPHPVKYMPDSTHRLQRSSLHKSRTDRMNSLPD